MCGIFSAVSTSNIAPLLVQGLMRLEYRGYDSAGLAVIDEQTDIQRLRAEGKVSGLSLQLQKTPVSGHVGIAHTRWATHGKPNETNAHPHVAGNRIDLVHNGIIENYLELKSRLEKAGFQFVSETDTEVIAFCIYEKLLKGASILQAVQAAGDELLGSYAICVLDKEAPQQLVAARRGSPLVIGIGVTGHFVASDPLALQVAAEQFLYLEEGDSAVITAVGFTVYDQHHKIANREIHSRRFRYDAADKGQYRHFMLKEIFEQSEAVQETLSDRVHHGLLVEESFGLNASRVFEKTKQILILACGTSYHAGLVARYWLEAMAGISTQVEIASEFRYRKRVILPGTLVVAISQSGETADTLAAIKSLSEPEICGTLAICNVPESALIRTCDLNFLTAAGPEIGVCSTKAFTTQLVALLLLTGIMAKRQGRLPLKEERELVQDLSHLPALIRAVLELNPVVQQLATQFADKNHSLFLGRGALFPIALEGALKLKEISYIHAEAYPAGELKHGPLALVDKNMPIVVVAPHSVVLEKLKSNIEEVRARGGRLMVFAAIDSGLKTEAEDLVVINLPSVSETLSPIIYSIALQLLAYHVAVLKGTDVDQPRNLAKSVTVE